MSVISVKSLSKSYEFYRKESGIYGTIKAFFFRKILHAVAADDISFEISSGEFVGFLGPNGAGKTTTLKMLSGILQPSGGSASVLGFQPSLRQPEYCRQFALVSGQAGQMLADLPARESFALYKEMYEMEEDVFEESQAELVELLELGSFFDIPVRKLSLGQRMKCEIAAALLHRPKVLFLDEPTIGLDVVAQKNIREFLRRYNERHKTTVILTSHYMEDIKELCERVIMIDEGKIVYDGKFSELVARHAPHKIVRAIFGGNGVGHEDIIRFGEIERCDSFNCSIRVPRADAKRVAAEILNSGLPVEDIEIEEPGIDDVMRKTMSKRA